MEKSSSHQDKKKRNSRLILAIIFSIFAVIDIVLAIIFIPRFFKKSKDSDQYVVLKQSIDRYNNILTYINKEVEGIYEESSSIVSYTLEDKTIKISTISNNEKSLYFEITTSFETYEDALKGFDNEVPVGSYATSVRYEDITSHSLNVVSDKYVCIHTSSSMESYISCTYLKDKTMYSYTHEHPLGDGSPDGYHKTVTYNESKELYDFYYYLIYKD